MNNIVNIEDMDKLCCGCRACGQKCANDAISFTENEEGFIYPKADEKRCVGCGLCKKTCPVLHPFFFTEPQKGYSAHLKDRILLRQSASGGVFYALALTVISNGGFVCGCLNDADGMPVHGIAGTIEEVKKMRGSKYVQSDTGRIYSEIEALLKTGKTVLFTGTPCQASAIRAFLDKKYDTLYCMDIICHGVPNGKLYREYLKWLAVQKKGAVKEYIFRSKRKHGWSLTYGAEIEKANGKRRFYESMASLDPYYYGFLQGYTYRESCYNCPFARMERPGDITVGDFWGIEKIYPGAYNKDGVSAVIINSKDGVSLFKQAEHLLNYSNAGILQIQKNNGNLNAPAQRPGIRDVIYKEINQKGFAEAVKKYMRSDRYLIDAIKDKIPNSLRQAVKFTLNHIHEKIIKK